MKLRVGDPCPDFVLPPENGVNALFYEKYCGTPTLLAFSDSLEPLPHLARLRSDDLNVVFLTSSPIHHSASNAHVFPTPGELMHRLQPERTSSPFAVLLDAHLRIRKQLSDIREDAITDALSVVDRSRPSGDILTKAAPVLFINDLIEPALAERLIDQHVADNFESEMPRSSNGQPLLAQDKGVKSRRDHLLRDQHLIDELTQELALRVVPPVTRSFHFQPRHFEGFKVVAYHAEEAGEFKAHRDNVAPDVRHRRLALSVNLNSDFDGGELVFPEHAFDRYRPDEGAGLVFSGSLLHQVRPVTRGVRYALLTFLW